MRTNFKVSFYLRSNYENKEGKSPVMLRVFLNGEMSNFGSTKIFVDKTVWNNATSRLKGRTAEALSVNAALDSISTTLNGIYRKFEDDESLSLEKIRSFFVGKDREYTTFLPIFDKFNEDVRQRVGHTISKDSLQKYSVLRRHFSEFLIHKYGRKDIGLTEFTPSVVQDFELYLSTVAGCAYNTSVKKMKALKTVTIYAQKRGYLLHDPFLNHRFHLEPVNRGFLTDEEIMKIANKDLAIQRLELVRDVFIFSCFTGLAYIDVSNLTPDNIVTLDDKQWIMTKRQKTSVETALKTVTIYAQKRGYLLHDPFLNHRFHLEPVNRGFLTDEEIMKIANKDLAIQRLELVRDVFIFSCFTGLAYIDVSNLTPDNIVTLDDKQWIMTKRQKTSVETNVLLLDIPKSIIAKYSHKTYRGGKLFPILTNQKTNAYLKEIADLCGVKKNLTFHLARHTFATMSLSKGVPMESVSKMLGHTNIKTTQIYARITNKKIEHDMEQLAGKLDKFNVAMGINSK